MTLTLEKSLLRRIKQHVGGRAHTFFAATAPGLESLCYQELISLPGSIEDARLVSGGVEFKGRLCDVYTASLELRTAGRIMMRVAGFKASNFRQLEKQANQIPWELFIHPATRLRIKVKTIHSRLYHTSALSDRFKQAIKTRLNGMSASDDPGADAPAIQNLFVRVLDDRFSVSLDSSGENLYKRGLKTNVGKAPLRETLAAAALTWAGYTGNEILIDPMCGSGSFSLEAALMANRIPPGWFREFAFMHWPAFKEKQWLHIKKERETSITRPTAPRIFASDIEPQACTSMASIVHRFDLGHTVRVARKDFFDLNPKKISETTGIVTLNPPYGLRLGSIGHSQRQYIEIAAKLKKDYRKWRVAILLPDRRMISNFPAGLNPRTIHHGGLDLTLLTGKI